MLEGKTIKRIGYEINYARSVIIETVGGEVWTIRAQGDVLQKIEKIECPIIMFMTDEQPKLHK